MSEPAASAAPPTRPGQGGDRAAVAPDADEVWRLLDLLGRGDVIMRALLLAPDRASRERCEDRAQAWVQDAQAWLHDVAQAWVRIPAPVVQRMAEAAADPDPSAAHAAPAWTPASRPGSGRAI